MKNFEGQKFLKGRSASKRIVNFARFWKKNLPQTISLHPIDPFTFLGAHNPSTNRPFHNFKASKIVYLETICSWEMSIDGFSGSIIVEESIYYQVIKICIANIFHPHKSITYISSYPTKLFTSYFKAYNSPIYTFRDSNDAF